MSSLNSYRELEHLRERLQEKRQNIATTVMVCGGPGCQASGSRAVIDAISDELSRQGLDQSVRLRVTGCHGFCEQGPIIVIEPGNIFYCRVSPADAFEIGIEFLLFDDVVDGRNTQPVKTVDIGVELVEAQFILNPQQDKQADSDPDCQSCDVD